jgi:hypothetical protein
MAPCGPLYPMALRLICPKKIWLIFPRAMSFPRVSRLNNFFSNRIYWNTISLCKKI